jgi:hypothetical protein
VICYIAQTILQTYRSMALQHKLDAEAAARKAAEDEAASRPAKLTWNLPRGPEVKASAIDCVPRPNRDYPPKPQPVPADTTTAQHESVSNKDTPSSSTSLTSPTSTTSSPLLRSLKLNRTAATGYRGRGVGAVSDRGGTARHESLHAQACCEKS